MQEKVHETRLILRQPTDLSLPATTFETVPGHHESHAGPYGVEMTPDWSFVITVTEVTIEAKGGSEGKGQRTLRRGSRAREKSNFGVPIFDTVINETGYNSGRYQCVYIPEALNIETVGL
jgi:hypothetical protein